MPSTKSDREQCETQSSPSQGKMVEKSEVVPSTEERADTGTPSPEQGHTIPASVATGSVWLRYAVAQTRTSHSEPSTET